MTSKRVRKRVSKRIGEIKRERERVKIVGKRESKRD